MGFKGEINQRANKLSWGWGGAWIREIRSFRARGPCEQGRAGTEEWAGGFRCSHPPGQGMGLVWGCGEAGQGLNCSELKVAVRTPEFTPRTTGSLICSMFMLVTSDSKDPSSREQVRDPAPRAHILFLAASSSLSAKRKRKSPLLPAGLLTRPKLGSEKARSQRRTARGLGWGSNALAVPGKEVSPQGGQWNLHIILNAWDQKAHIEMWRKSLLRKRNVMSWCFWGIRLNAIKVQHQGWAPAEKFTSDRAVPKEANDSIQKVLIDGCMGWQLRESSGATGEQNKIHSPREFTVELTRQDYIQVTPGLVLKKEIWENRYQVNKNRERDLGQVIRAAILEAVGFRQA